MVVSNGVGNCIQSALAVKMPMPNSLLFPSNNFTVPTWPSKPVQPLPLTMPVIFTGDEITLFAVGNVISIPSFPCGGGFSAGGLLAGSKKKIAARAIITTPAPIAKNIFLFMLYLFKKMDVGRPSVSILNSNCKKRKGRFDPRTIKKYDEDRLKGRFKILLT